MLTGGLETAVVVGRDVWRTSILTNYMIKALGKPCFILKLIRFGDGALLRRRAPRMKRSAGQISGRRSCSDLETPQIGRQ